MEATSWRGSPRVRLQTVPGSFWSAPTVAWCSCDGCCWSSLSGSSAARIPWVLSVIRSATSASALPRSTTSSVVVRLFCGAPWTSATPASVPSVSRSWPCCRRDQSRASVRRLNVFIYAQHLSGVGHMIRAQQIGLALAARHSVRILDGGRPLPFPRPLQPVAVPALVRREKRTVPIDPSLTLSQALRLRRRQLAAMLGEHRPDVILVEHYPFSKWELGPEIIALLDMARQLNPAVAVVASLRDVCLRTSQEPAEDYEKRVLALLDRYFDGLLVHADPALCQLQDYFAASGCIGIPVFHTGIVAAALAQSAPRPSAAEPWIVASAGGGADRAGLLSRMV